MAASVENPQLTTDVVVVGSVASGAGVRAAQSEALDELVERVATRGVDGAVLADALAVYGAAVDGRATRARGVPVAPDARAPDADVPRRAGVARDHVRLRWHPGLARRGGPRRAGVAVPVLFAAGADVGGISHWPYAVGLAPCFITGMWAGAAAGWSAR